MKLCLSVLMLLISVASLDAAGLPGGFDFDRPTCFERVYTSAHLKKHPLQKVAMIRFEHFPALWGPIGNDDKVNPRLAPDRVSFSIYVRLRGNKKRQYNSGECNRKKGYMRCQIECDGGGFNFIREGKGKALIRNRGFAIVGCGEGDDESDGWMLNPEPDDKAFRLYRLPQKNCRKPLVNSGY